MSDILPDEKIQEIAARADAAQVLLSQSSIRQITYLDIEPMLVRDYYEKQEGSLWTGNTYNVAQLFAHSFTDIPALLAHADALQANEVELRHELALVDEAFARRPALEQYDTRYAKAYFACAEARNADEFRHTIAHLEAASASQVERIGKLEAALRELANSPVEFSDARINCVTLQVDVDVMREAQALLEPVVPAVDAQKEDGDAG